MPKRIQLKRTKGWRLPEATRVVTRSTIFGNPWAAGADGAFWWPSDPTGRRWISTHPIPRGRISASDAVEMFRAWLDGYAVPREYRPCSMTPLGQRECWDALAKRRTYGSYKQMEERDGAS